MAPNTGAIATFETQKDAYAAGYTVPLTQAEAGALMPMTRPQRLDWLRDRRPFPVKRRNRRHSR